MTIDAIDAQLVAALQADAKTPLAKLGEQVGLSAPSVLERVRKLEHAGVITGYHARVEARSVGLDIAAFVGVRIQSKQLGSVGAWAEGVPQVLECHHVTGNYSLLLKVKAKNTPALEELLNRIRSLDGVTSTDTMFVFSTSVERMEVPIETPKATAPRRRRRQASSS